MDQDTCIMPISPYRYRNYAILHTTGLYKVFDIMRYDRVHLVRTKDVEDINITFTQAEYSFALKPFSLLLCRYGTKRKPGWTHEQLLSNQRLEEITDETNLFAMLPCWTGPTIKPAIKWTTAAPCMDHSYTSHT